MANPQIIDLLQRDLDQELTSTDQQYLDVYLASSPEDAAMASRFQQLVFELSNLCKVTPVLPLTEMVLEQMEEEERQQHRTQILRRWKIASIGIGIVAILLTAVIAFMPIGTTSWPMKILANPRLFTESVKKGGILSPDKDLVALWDEKNQIQVYDKKGNEAIPKQSMVSAKDPKIEWLNNDRFIVKFTDSVGGIVTFEFPVETNAKKR
ncbi:hypothetical protein [Thermoactinomyces sp. DSM 45892]|uniref:hypothetical protein n=1 Tax=Thermoactinomyces sp. DSM 45892 TaxID=1882753 RepID=UPI0008996846|nr:hypothetical protein [Thermoactinomyces sp. DSM 45892]SDZ24719.1 hypothetical protein SAMN05444416_11766 [Thermoactinomyces sp. DSM 45892]